MLSTCKIKNIDSSPGTYCGKVLQPNEEYLIPDYRRVQWSSDDEVISGITGHKIQVGDGSSYINEISEQVNYLKSVQREDSFGKCIVHQTSCPLGYITGWFGEGDDVTDPTKVGGGQRLVYHHLVSDPVSESVIIGLNIKENGTYIHEGFIDCLDAKLDYVHAEVIPIVTESSAGSETNYNNYYGVIIPAAGDGTLVIEDSARKLVQVFTDPNTKIKPDAYWNADYNTSTHEFENISAAPAGNGDYNMFSTINVPTIFPKRFWHAIPLLGNTSKWMQSADAVPLGSNMQIKIIFNTYGDDHEWWSGITVVPHRQRLI